MFRCFAAAILAATVCVVAIAAPAQAQNQRFQIAPGDLGQALDAYIHQSGRQLIYRVDDVRGVHSPGVQGEMSADDALAALLSGTGFSSRSDSSGALAIVRADAPLSEIVVTATPLLHASICQPANESRLRPGLPAWTIGAPSNTACPSVPHACV